MEPLRDHLTAGIGWREKPGTGPVLVCLHGIGSQASAFDAMVGHLPDDFRVISWQAPGYGPSAPLPMDWPCAADYAGALARLLAALELTRVHLLGHSLGTLIAAAFAAERPATVASLTLASSAQGGGVMPGSPLPASATARLDDLRALGPAAFAEARAARLVFQPEANPALVAAVREGMARVGLPGYAQAVRMLASGDLAADCARLSVPVRLVVGAEDLVTPPAQSERALAALPPGIGRGLTLVAGAGHALHLQAPAALAAVVAKAIKQTAQPACAPLEGLTR